MSKSSIARVALPAIVFAMGCGSVHAGSINYFSNVYFDTYNPGDQANNTSLSHSLTENGATNSASSNLATGKLGILNAGSNVTTSFLFSQVIAQFGDTITASGPASGLHGLNLHANLNISGTTSFDNPAENSTFLWVFAYKPGTFDKAFYNDPSNILLAKAYALGNGTESTVRDQLFAANNVLLTATYGDSASIPLDLSFDTLGSNFQLNFVLNSIMYDPNGVVNDNWSADFSHTVEVSLSASPGVTLYSSSGVLPGTVAAVPLPPAAWAGFTLLGGLVAARWSRRAVARTC